MFIDKYLTFIQLEASYVGNLGFEEMIRFYQKATPAQAKLMDRIANTGNWKAAKVLIKRVLHVSLRRMSKGVV